MPISEGNTQYNSAMNSDDLAAILDPNQDFSLQDILGRVRSTEVAQGAVRSHAEDIGQVNPNIIEHMVDRIQNNPVKLAEMAERVKKLQRQAKILLEDNNSLQENAHIQLADDQQVMSGQEQIRQVMNVLDNLAAKIQNKLSE